MINLLVKNFNDKIKNFINQYEGSLKSKGKKAPIKNPYQAFYDEQLEELQQHQLECPKCGHKGEMIKWGYCHKSIKTPFGIIILKLQRYRCKACKSTHALLLSAFIPYSQLLLPDAVNIINAETPEKYEEIMIENLCIDESTISTTISKYRKHWKQKLLSRNIDARASDLVEQCFLHFRMQFMQIRCTKNILYINTNTG